MILAMLARLRAWRRRVPHSTDMKHSTEHTSTPDEHPSSDAAHLGQLVRAGRVVDLRRHIAGHRDAFVRWYQDPDIAELLRHDLSPLTAIQARGYYDSIILPASSRGTCWAIHEHANGRLVGSTAVTDIDRRTGSSMFRLVIGEKERWGHGFGTEATDLAMAEAFLTLGLRRVNLEVFAHNPRAQGAYLRIGFRQTGRHTEWVPGVRRQIEVLEMSIDRATWLGRTTREVPGDQRD
jgi:RimJ/RimL family protein N-acetyltransferase